MQQRMQKIKKRGWIICAAVLALCIQICANAALEGDNFAEVKETEVNFEYTITTDSDEWKAIDTVDERIEACRIPNEVLSKLSSEQLVELVLEFPYSINLFIYSTPEYGVSELADISDAYAELITRDDSITAIESKINELSNVDEMTAEDEINLDILSIILLYEEEYSYELTMEQVLYVDRTSKLVDVTIHPATAEISSTYSTQVHTPYGTAVPVISRDCAHHTLDYHSTEDARIMSNYPNIELISTGTCKYNCHSYAWYNQSTNNQYWMNNPEAYMTDNSYRRIISGMNTFSNTVNQWDVVFYGTTDNLYSAHSAIIYDAACGSPLSTRYATSKWGICGVFKHTVSDVHNSYNTSVVTVWRKR